MIKSVLRLTASLFVIGAGPAHAQNFLMNSAETINKGNFKIAGFPTVLFGKNGTDDEWGVATRFGYGFTNNFDVEGKVAFFDGFKLYGADAELWLVKGGADVSVAAGAHKADVDGGFDSTAIDASLLVSGNIAPRLELYGGASLSFEHLSDVNESDFTRAYLVPGIEYKVSDQIDLLAEFGIGLNHDSPNYVSFGLAVYLR
jgi:Outer membrane protein beta-barrel domain